MLAAGTVCVLTVAPAMAQTATTPTTPPASTGAPVPATPPAPAAPAPAAAPTGAEPRVPATTTAASPFKADRVSSEPLGLFPNQTTDPFTFPVEPIVLEWSPVPGAISYKVEVATSPGFNFIIWSTNTDQPMVAPEVLLPDGTYWWRVTATDKAGTVGIVSSVATFAKEWPSKVTGGVLSASPLGDATSLVRTTPYMRWDPVPGASGYETEIAAADQFAKPAFFSKYYPNTSMHPGSFGILPDDSYTWRVRALDGNKNPGPWATMGPFTKAWTPVNVIGPADGAVTSDVNLQWEPLPGAEKYQVQVTRQENVWQGENLVISSITGNAGMTPSLKEVDAKDMAPGTHWWRVRPVVNERYGTWSNPRRIVWTDPATASVGVTRPTLTTAADSSSALSPTMQWTPVTGAHIYRIDVATDSQFNHIVESSHTVSPSWTPRLPLTDNQVREGYFWRVVWGTGYTEELPAWSEDESRVPVSQYRKQTNVVLGDSASGIVPEPPMMTWNDVLGAARYELQLSRDTEFDPNRTKSVITWSLGSPWIKDQGKRLGGGNWYWRVRAIDAAGTGQTWSPVKSFTVEPPRVTVTAPNDGATVVGSPLITWKDQNGACTYQVQVADNPGFQDASTSTTPVVDAGGGGNTAGGNKGAAPEAKGAIGTPQTALVPTGAIVNRPGTWYYRVRTAFCGDDDYSAWSPARRFNSVRAPQFNLNTLPNQAAYGTKLMIGGRLVHNGAGVAKPQLVLEQRVWPSNEFRQVGTVNGDDSGRFAFRLPIQRTAAWRLRWAATDTHPEGVAPFVIRATPRVSFSLSRSRVVRTGSLRVKGSVFPKRSAEIQVRDSDGWRTIKKIPAGRARFQMSLRLGLTTGAQKLRLFVPQDAARTLEPTPSRHRSLFVYDRFIVKGR